MEILGLCFDSTSPGAATGHDPSLVALSFFAAAFASFTALDMAERLRRTTGGARRLWHWGSAIALGGGIWSMHFIAMLAYQTPFENTYDPGLTALSGIIAVLVVWAGLRVAGPAGDPRRVLGAGIIVGLGVVTMHYTGMEAMRVPGEVVYRPGLFTLSVLIALAAATVALFLAQRLNHAWKRVVAAVVMAVAICGMHYTGMAGTAIIVGLSESAPGAVVGAPALAIGVAIGLFAILFLGLVAAMVDRRLEARSHLEAGRLKLLNESLEHRVEERTRALTTAMVELDRARADADSANRAKSEFLANMSHEIRTPLNGVVGVADMLARADLPAREAELAQLISTSAVALERLLCDVLDLARVEAGQVTIEAHPFDIARLVRDVAALLRLKADEKGVTIEVSLPDGLREWRSGDAGRIRQILTNLVSNAIKFTPRGSVTIGVENLTDASLRLVVTDTGVGFDQAGRERIFSRFQQADGSITRRFGGSGLGLAISRQLVELMGGRIDCASSPGLGSRFWAELPLPVAQAEHAAAEPDVLTTDFATIRILVADDHPTNQKVVQLMLGGLGVETEVVENGAEAVAAAAGGGFDVILMDMQMPVMDGLEATRRIRYEEGERRVGRTPVIMLTANALPEQREAGRDAGADLHLAKPFTVETLLAAIDAALNLCERRRDVA